MEKQKIIMILLFATLSLNIIALIPQSANAQTLQPQKITGFGANILATHYQESTGILWALGGSISTEGIAYLYNVNPVTRVITTTYNMSSYMHSGAPVDLWCGDTSCFITSRGTTTSATKGAIVRVETVGDDIGTISGMLNATNTMRGFGSLDGRDSTGTGIGGIALYTESWNSSDNKMFLIVGAVGTMAVSATLNTFVDGPLSSTTGISSDIRWSGIAGSTNNFLATISWSSATVLSARLFNLATLATTCNVSVTVASGTQGGQIIFDIDNNRYIVPSGSNGDYTAINTLTCAATNGFITDSTTGLSGTATQKNGMIIGQKDLIMFQESGAVARLSFMTWNGTYPTGTPLIVQTSPNNSQSAQIGRAYLAVEHDTDGQPTTLSNIGTDPVFNAIFIPMGADNTVYVYRFEAPTVPNIVTGIDCSLPENVNILICRVAPDGVIGGSSGIINTGVLDILVSAGVISGDDTNPQTNGVGYIITFISLAVMTGIMFVFTHGHLKEVPTFIWVISSVAIIGTMTAIGWIDPTFLVVSIIVIVSLAAMQIRNVIGSSIDFASGGNF